MIVILEPNINKVGETYRRLMDHLGHLPNVQVRIHEEKGAQQVLTEVYLIGDTAALDAQSIANLPGVERVVRISQEYRILGRHRDDSRSTHSDYNGVTFSQDNLHIFAGLCAVSSREHVEAMLKALQQHGQVCTRMGAYKPRTNPYAFQGFGKDCLPYVFELAGKYGIKVIAMEILSEGHFQEIAEALHRCGSPTGVMLQIGTRNTQNFELLKVCGRQREFPVLLKRGFGITLEESLNAAEYLASEGNPKVIFALRGMKTNMGDPHRNFVDFAHVPTVKRLTRMPVCIDPSHSVGTRAQSPDGLLEIMHVTAQGIIAGANMILVDFHPEPGKALVDGPQALTLKELPYFIEDVMVTRAAYEKRVSNARQFQERPL